MHIFIFKGGNLDGKAFKTYEIEDELRPGFWFEFEDSSEMYKMVSVEKVGGTYLVNLKRISSFAAFLKRLHWLIKGTL